MTRIRTGTIVVTTTVHGTVTSYTTYCPIPEFSEALSTFLPILEATITAVVVALGNSIVQATSRTGNSPWEDNDTVSKTVLSTVMENVVTTVSGIVYTTKCPVLEPTSTIQLMGVTVTICNGNDELCSSMTPEVELVASTKNGANSHFTGHLSLSGSYSYSKELSKSHNHSDEMGSYTPASQVTFVTLFTSSITSAETPKFTNLGETSTVHVQSAIVENKAYSTTYDFFVFVVSLFVVFV